MKIRIDKKKVGNRILQIRNSLDYTLEEFGNMKEIQAERSNVSKWERGFSLPNRVRLEKIAKIGNVTFNQLLYGSIDEFLESNIEELIKESDYPIDLTDNEISEKLKRELIDYVLLRLNEYSGYQQAENLIDNIDTLCSKASSFFSEYIYNDTDTLLELFSQYSRETEEVLEKFPTKEDINRFGISSETLEILNTVDNLISYLTCIDEDGITEDYLMLKYLYNLVIEKVKNNGFYLQERVTLFITLANIIQNNINLHTDNYIGFDFIFKENTFVLDKYNLSEYDIVIGLKIEEKQTLYYLANYTRIEDVPLNKEAEYFILNHDNSYFITKITEIPDCKYIAPIIGRLE